MKLNDQFFSCTIPMINYLVKVTELDFSSSKLFLTVIP